MKKHKTILLMLVSLFSIAMIILIPEFSKLFISISVVSMALAIFND